MKKIQPQNTSKSRQPFTAALVFMLILFGQASYAQYNLPKSEVLIKNNVGVIHVTKTPLRKENAKNRDISKKSFDKTPRRLTSYFISHSGRIDSVYQYYPDTSRYTKQIFRFGLDNQLQEITSIHPDGEVIKRTLLEQTPEGEFHLRTWRQDVLMYDLKITKDSIIYEMTNYESFNPVTRYTKTFYNLEKETMSKFTYEGDYLILKETYEWLARNGVPHYFIFTKHTFEEGNEKPIRETQEYNVADDGSVKSKNKGRFTDPFYSFNYFDRHEYFKGIQHPFAHLLRADTLVSEQQASEMAGFDGSKIVYVYSMDYEMYD